MSNLKMLVLAIFAVALMATTAVALTAEKGDDTGEAAVITLTEIGNAEFPEAQKLPSGRIGVVVSSDDGGCPEGPNGEAACVCTGYIYNPATETSYWTTYTTSGCYPDPLLGCRDCCFRVMDDIGPHSGL